MPRENNERYRRPIRSCWAAVPDSSLSVRKQQRGGREELGENSRSDVGDDQSGKVGSFIKIFVYLPLKYFFKNINISKNI